MFAQKHRLCKTQDIQQALKLGRAFFSPFFNVRFLPSVQGKRFAVVVSVKSAKKAVRRNRIKRILREYVRLHLANFSNGDYVIMARPLAGKQDDAVLLSAFAAFLKTAKIFRHYEASE